MTKRRFPRPVKFASGIVTIHIQLRRGVTKTLGLN